MSRALIALLMLAGCPNRSAQVEVKRAVSPAAPHKGTRSRLAWVTWDGGKPVACNHRVDDSAVTVGTPGPCLGGKKYDSIGVDARSLPDHQPADQGPWTDCWLTIEDAQLVPSKKPARLVLHKPSGEQEIAKWSPDGVPGDAFHLEASFDPARTQMAVMRVAVGLGEGERTVEVVDLVVLPTPQCH